MNLTFLQRFQITGEHRRKLYGTLSKVAADGKSWYAALEVMGAEFSRNKHPLAPMAKIVLLRMRGAGVSRAGQAKRTLGTELAGMVPDDEAMLIQAGETSGDMAAGLTNAAELVQSKSRLKSAIWKAMVKPVGYFLALMGVLIYMSHTLLPKFEAVRARDKWGDDGQLLGTVADHVTLIVSLSVGLLVALVLAFQWIVPLWTGEARHKADRHVFPFTLVAEINGASFLKTLAGYIASGTPFPEAVKNVAATATPYMRWQCHLLMDMMRRGKRGEEALCQLSIVPPKYHWIIKVYAMSEDAAKVYEDIAEELTNNVEEFVTKLFGYVGTAMQFAVGLIVIWIYGGLYDIAGA